MRKKILTIILMISLVVWFFPNEKSEAAITDGTGGNNNWVDTGNETAQTSTAWTVGRTISSGQLAVIAVSIDNKSTTDGQTSDVSNVTDSKSNTWTKAGEYTNTVGGAANDGAAVAVWFSVLTTTLTASTDTVTTSYSASVTAKAVDGLFYSIGAGSTIAVSGTLQTLSNDNADAGSQTISGLTSGEYLFIRATSSETDTTGASPSTNYSSVVSGSGSGGSEKGHISDFLEARILTATGDSTNPTMTDTTADRASVYLALKETALSGNVKTAVGLAEASVKTKNGLANASVKTMNGLSMP